MVFGFSIWNAHWFGYRHIDWWFIREYCKSMEMKTQLEKQVKKCIQCHQMAECGFFFIITIHNSTHTGDHDICRVLFIFYIVRYILEQCFLSKSTHIIPLLNAFLLVQNLARFVCVSKQSLYYRFDSIENSNKNKIIKWKPGTCRVHKNDAYANCFNWIFIRSRALYL